MAFKKFIGINTSSIAIIKGRNKNPITPAPGVHGPDGDNFSRKSKPKIAIR
ncbi:MAG: hypothetical protein JST96_02390 [Bacteroidetes bacterium]|nr:hypothetical protein [Bacteroidota bacterium]